MPVLHLFEGFGVELEYMIVDADTLKVLPISDKLLTEEGEKEGADESDEIAWSNELVMHVLELKTSKPAKTLHNLYSSFQKDIIEINARLKSKNAFLLPSAMHPFMDPYKEMKLWPYDAGEIYSKYDEIFNCKGHGWANLQSVHLNLPFADDKEFEKLHAAIRVVLPILPAIAASSPVMEGKFTGLKDTRLEVYQQNQKRVPSIAGKVIPERAFSKQEYENLIFKKVFKDIAPFDPDGILQEEWLNSRGAIARFSRNAIEIRVLDIQECPMADLAVLNAIVNLIRNLIDERWAGLEEQKQWDEEILYQFFSQTIKNAEETVYTDEKYLKLFGFPEKKAKASELWDYFLGTFSLDTELEKAIRVILNKGTLSTRITKAIGKEIKHGKIMDVYHHLAYCLQNGEMFL